MVGFFISEPVATAPDREADMGQWRDRIGEWREFLRAGIWEVEAGQLTRWQFFLLRQAQVAALVFRDFFADRCLLRASALTYTTLLSIVPLLALMFSVLKGLGVQNTLEPILLHRFTVGSEEIVTQIIHYINNTSVGRLGTVGLLLLITTVITLLSNIEKSFNHIWGVSETRTLFRRFSDYLSVVVIGPIFILAAVSMTTTLASQDIVRKLMQMAYVGHLLLFLFQVLPYLAMWAAFIFLYIFMPNSKVRLQAALVGGIFGGTLWQVAQWSYVTFQVGVSRYNAIYGTMAALPIFMVWIYFSWIIVLLGLEVTYATQNLRTIRREIRGGEVNFASRELVALSVLLVVCEAFQRGEKPWGEEQIAAALELPPRLARHIVADLVRLGLLAEVRRRDREEEFAYQPGRAPESMALHALIETLKADGVSYTRLRPTPERAVVQELEERLRLAGRQTLEGLTMRDLVAQLATREEGG